MNLLDPVSTIMTTNVTSVSPEDTMKKVEEIFQNESFHHLPVVWDDHLVGMVSKSDYLFFKRGFNDDTTDARVDLLRLKTRKVKEFMTSGLAHLEPEDKINVALEVFKENIFHAIPVVKEGKLVGIITTLDIIKQLAETGERTYRLKE